MQVLLISITAWACACACRSARLACNTHLDHSTNNKLVLFSSHIAPRDAVCMLVVVSLCTLIPGITSRAACTPSWASSRQGSSKGVTTPRP